MQYKMVVLDLDDTLLDKEHNISQATRNTLNKLKEMGVEIVVATGRMYCSALPYIKQLGLVGSMITYNGAYIKNVKRDEVIFHKPIDLEIAREILLAAEEAGLFTNIYIDDKLYVEETGRETELYKKISGVDANPVGKLSKFIYDAPTKILIVEEDLEKNQYYRKQFKDKYGHKLEVTNSKAYFIEFMSKGVSKGNAIEVIAGEFNIELKETIAIGDSWNDLEMIQTAGLGIAMENAPDGVKTYADRIAGKHDDEGVSNVLKDIFNLKE
ncbi:MAG: Cof-type HAD-IIB family hydrolase [Halanaerobiales bacterium]